MNVVYRSVILLFCSYGSYCVKYGFQNDEISSVKVDGISEDDVSNAARKGALESNFAVSQSSNDVQQQPTTNSFANDVLFIAVLVSVSAAAIIGIVIAIVCCCKLKKQVKESSELEYPGYGSMDYKGAIPATKTADRRLAQSAQMYHYQHQKQQMLEMEKNQNPVSKSGSETSTDDENDASEYTVYECPGLATAGEMEVPNPLFAEPPANALYPEIPQHPTEDRPPSQVMNGYHEP